MSTAGKKGVSDVQAPGETRSAEPTPSAPAANGVASTDTIAAKGVASSDTLADAHRDVTRALGLVLATPGVPEALRAAGRLDGARRVLHRHLEIARGES